MKKHLIWPLSLALTYFLLLIGIFSLIDHLEDRNNKKCRFAYGDKFVWEGNSISGHMICVEPMKREFKYLGIDK